VLDAFGIDDRAAEPDMRRWDDVIDRLLNTRRAR
jgi:hypothetical protein